MSNRIVMLFGAIALALGAYIYYVEIPADVAKQDAELLFAKVDKAAIKAVTLKNEKGEVTLNNLAPKLVEDKKLEESADKTSTFDHDPLNSWEIAGIKGAKIDSGALNGLLSSITSFKLDSKIDKEDLESDMSIYGLDKPSATIKVVLGSAPDTVIELGKKSDFTFKQYAKIQGRDGVYLVSATIGDAAGKSAAEYRNKKPFDFSDISLSEVLFKSETQNVKLSTDGFLNWRIKEPGDFTADPEKALEILRAVKNTTAESFIDPTSETSTPDLKKYGLHEPALVINGSFDAKSPAKKFSFAFGVVAEEKKEEKSKDGKAEDKSATATEVVKKVYAKVDGIDTIYQLNADALNAITPKVEVLRQAKLVHITDHKIKRITIQPDGAPEVLLEKEDSGWKAGGRPADEPFVRELIAVMENFSAVAYPQVNKDFGFSKPYLKVIAASEEKSDVKSPSPSPQENVVQRQIPTKVEIVVGGEAQSSEYTLIDPTNTSLAQSKMRYAVVRLDPNNNEPEEPIVVTEDSLKRLMPQLDAFLKVEKPSPAPSPTEDRK